MYKKVLHDLILKEFKSEPIKIISLPDHINVLVSFLVIKSCGLLKTFKSRGNSLN